MTPKQRKTLHSSKKQDWRTPKWLFDALNKIYHFDLDAAADRENALCKNFYSVENSAFQTREWAFKRAAWVNPPYGRDLLAWVEFAGVASEERKKPVVMLVPARTDTAWFMLAAEYADTDIILLPGRLTFEGALAPAPFPSCLVLFNSTSRQTDRVLSLFGFIGKARIHRPRRWKILDLK